MLFTWSNKDGQNAAEQSRWLLRQQPGIRLHKKAMSQQWAVSPFLKVNEINTSFDKSIEYSGQIMLHF